MHGHPNVGVKPRVTERADWNQVEYTRTLHTRRPCVAMPRELVALMAIVGLAVLLVVVALFSLATGPVKVPVLAILRDAVTGAFQPEDLLSARDRIVLLEIRLPRVLLGALVGAALAVTGAVLQGLFRNPLADPGLVGVSAGAGLGAASFIVLGSTTLAPVAALFGSYAIPLTAFLGGLATTWLLYKIATRRGVTSIATLLLAGIALAALAGALTGLLVFVGDDQQVRDLNFWALGSLAGSNWEKLTAAAPLICASIAVMFCLTRGLNGLMLGDAAARHIGIRVQRLKTLAILAVAAATGAAVAVSGGIGFVGIVVPHLIRLTLGPDHRYLLPASVLLGGSLLIAADTISRTIVAPAELPIGIITAFAGAPFFLWILLRKKSQVSF